MCWCACKHHANGAAALILVLELQHVSLIKLISSLVKTPERRRWTTGPVLGAAALVFRQRFCCEGSDLVSGLGHVHLKRHFQLLVLLIHLIQLRLSFGQLLVGRLPQRQKHIITSRLCKAPVSRCSEPVMYQFIRVVLVFEGFQLVLARLQLVRQAV